MKLLYSNILPLGIEDNQETIMNCFNEQMKMADRVEIAVGYTSNASLVELDRLVDGLSTLFQTNFFRLFFRYCTGV